MNRISKRGRWSNRAGIFTACCLLCAGTTAAWAQPTALPDADELYKEAFNAGVQRDFVQAELLLRDMRMAFPKDFRWAAALLPILVEQGKLPEALRLGREVEPQFSNASSFCLEYGAVLFRAQRFDQAVEQYERGLRLANNDISRRYAQDSIGNVYMAQEDWPKAIEAFRKGREITGDPSFGLAFSLSHVGRPTEAIAEYRALLRVSPLPVVMNNLAYELAEQDMNLDEALDLALRASGSTPGDSPVTDTVGWIYYKQGRYEEAEEVLVKAIRQEGGNQPVLKQHLAAAMDARALWNEDRRLLRGLLEKELSRSETRRMLELLGAMER